MVNITSSRRSGTKLINHVAQVEGRHAHTLCVSLLLNMHKKECLQIILHVILLAPTRNMPVGTHTSRMCANGHPVGPVQQEPCGAQAI
jgi:hypothetical protein